MRMPEKLAGHTLTTEARIYPQKMSIDLQMDEISTASMTLDEDQPKMKPGDWVRIWAPNGQCVIMHVQTHETDPIEKTIKIGLQEIFGQLDEMVMFEEITPETLGGSGSKTISAETAIKAVLDRQTETLFKYGGCDFTDSQGWKFTNTTIRSALTDIAEAIAECQWEIDYTSLPFSLSLKKFPTAAIMEMRRNRNLDTMQISLDRSQMYTRVYPIGNKDLHLTEKYLESNTGTWGIVSQVITDSSIESEGLLRAWAAAQLKRNSEPVITISISGQELSAETGEPLDRLTTGRICRVPLPEYGTTVRQRLVRLEWRDCMADEKAVNVNLANQHKTIQGLLYEKSRGGSSGGAKSGVRGGCDLHDHDEEFKEFTTEYERTERELNEKATHWDENGEIIKQAGLHLDNEGVIAYATDNQRMIGSQITSLSNQASMTVGKYTIDESKIRRYAGKSAFPKEGVEGTFYVDTSTGKTYAWRNGAYTELQVGENGEGYYVKAGEIAIAINESGESEAIINANKVKISAKNQSLDSWAENTETSITVESGRITQEVSRAQEAEGILSGKITVEAGRITQEVSRAQEAEGILSGKIEVQANQIALRVSKGDVATQLAVEMGNVSVTGGNLTVSGMVTASAVSAALADLDNAYIDGTLEIGGWLDCGDIDCGDIDSGKIDASGDITTLGTLTVGDALMKVADITVSGNTMTITYNDGRSPQTFSKATSLRGTWSGATFTVKATPQNETASTTIGAVNVKDGTALHSGSKSILDVPVAVADSDGVEHYTQTLNVNALAAYTAGKTDGAASVNKKVVYDSTDKSVKYASSGGSDSILISLNKGAVTGSGASGKRTISCAAGSVQVDSAEITDYGDGYTAGNANRGSQILTLAKTTGSVSQTLEANSTYLITSQYKKVDNTWANGGTMVIKTASGTPYAVPVASGTYAEGWNAARAAIYRKDNIIYRPKVATEGGSKTPGTEKAYTADYTESTDSYKSSSHSHSYTAASLKIGGTDYSTSSLNVDVAYLSGKLVYSPAKHSDSYTASTHSYSKSSLTWTDH